MSRGIIGLTTHISGDDTMPKLIKDYFWAKLSEIKLSENSTQEQKDMRLRNLGFTGNMKLYESVNKYPGKYFVYMDNGTKYFHTGCGSLLNNHSSISIITDEGEFTFDIIYPDYYD